MTVSTFSIAATAGDGQTDQAGAAYPPTGTIGVTTDGQNIAANRQVSGGNFNVQALFFRWDTSSIPDGDTVKAADFKPHVRSKTDSDARSLVA